MVEYKVNYNKNSVEQIEVKGHASNDYGNDIVCASISTAIIVTVNAIERLSLINNIKYQLKDGYFIVNQIVNNEIVNSLLENLVYTLNELKKEYPKKLTEKEWNHA